MDQNVKFVKVNLRESQKYKTQHIPNMPKITVSLAESPPPIAHACNVFDDEKQMISLLEIPEQDIPPLERSYEVRPDRSRKYIKRSMKKHRSNPDARQAKELIEKGGLASMIDHFESTTNSELTILKSVKAKILADSLKKKHERS